MAATPGRIAASSAAPIKPRVDGVSGTCTETTSEIRRSSSIVAGSTPGERAAFELVEIRRHPQGGEALRDRGADAPQPDQPDRATRDHAAHRSEEHTSELQSRENLVCRL